MSDERVQATRTMAASASTVFAVLADPTTHAAIDGTGWVSQALDQAPVTAVGQVFRMAMYHPEHPDRDYETHNLVIAFEQDRVIAWRPGYVDAERPGRLGFGGWTWRYDLTPLGPAETEVTHTYDWSAVGPGPREYLTFPPFPPDHLANSLAHLADLVKGRTDRSPAAP
jgi:hypothetical protein